MCLLLRLVVVLVVCLTSAAGQTPDRSIAAYRRIVDDYRRYGAPAVRQVAAFPEPEIGALAGAAISSSDPAGAWSWEELRAAAMLHTEAVADRLTAKQTAVAQTHLDTAARLLDRVVHLAPEQKDFSHRWHSLMPPLLRMLGAPTFAGIVSTRMKERFSGEEGRARERFASGLRYELNGGIEATALSAQQFGEVGQDSVLPSRWWGPAATEYQAALAADPRLLQAALHLGRVRMLEGRLDEAVTLLATASKAVDPRVRYLALLFAGSIVERRGDFAAAEQGYRAAIAEFPWGQSGQLALAQLLSRTGRDAEGRTLLLERFSDRPNIVEPLWTYVIRPGDELGALFDELRMEVSK